MQVNTKWKQTLKFLMLSGILEHISETKDGHTWLYSIRKALLVTGFQVY